MLCEDWHCCCRLTIFLNLTLTLLGWARKTTEIGKGYISVLWLKLGQLQKICNKPIKDTRLYAALSSIRVCRMVDETHIRAKKGSKSKGKSLRQIEVDIKLCGNQDYCDKKCCRSKVKVETHRRQACEFGELKFIQSCEHERQLMTFLTFRFFTVSRAHFLTIIWLSILTY